MTPPTRRRRAAPGVAVLAALALAGLTACAIPLGGGANQSAASPKAMAACRQRADAVYTMQNRDAVYRADMFAGTQRDAPFAAAGVAANASSGLSARYARDTMVDDCLRGASGSADAPPAAPEPAPVAAKPAR